eukprot:GHUV01051695.1.p1 GENE.GHUV01051695.1~~GHUV01051695.1.p1  ORF type:complete len:122 (+),score=24.97 GHUV01051695.1:27-392(+)
MSRWPYQHHVLHWTPRRTGGVRAGGRQCHGWYALKHLCQARSATHAVNIDLMLSSHQPEVDLLVIMLQAGTLCCCTRLQILLSAACVINAVSSFTLSAGCCCGANDQYLPHATGVPHAAGS